MLINYASNRILNFQELGIVRHWIDNTYKSMHTGDTSIKSLDEGPTMAINVLSLNELRSVFLVWFLGLIISATAFAYEMSLHFWFKKFFEASQTRNKIVSLI